MVRTYTLALAALLGLSGCDATRPPITTGYSVHTQRGFVLARPALFDQTQDAAVYVSPAVETNGNNTRWFIATSVASSGPNYPMITETWSFGDRLNYQRRDRRRTGCDTHCLREEVGEIVLTRTQFETAARDGFSFQMNGRRGSYSGEIPANAFQNVLTKLAHSSR